MQQFKIRQRPLRVWMGRTALQAGSSRESGRMGTLSRSLSKDQAIGSRFRGTPAH